MVSSAEGVACINLIPIYVRLYCRDLAYVELGRPFHLFVRRNLKRRITMNLVRYYVHPGTDFRAKAALLAALMAVYASSPGQSQTVLSAPAPSGVTGFSLLAVGGQPSAPRVPTLPPPLPDAPQPANTVGWPS